MGVGAAGTSTKRLRSQPDDRGHQYERDGEADVGADHDLGLDAAKGIEGRPGQGGGIDRRQRTQNQNRSDVGK